MTGRTFGGDAFGLPIRMIDAEFEIDATEELVLVGMRPHE